MTEDEIDALIERVADAELKYRVGIIHTAFVPG